MTQPHRADVVIAATGEVFEPVFVFVFTDDIDIAVPNESCDRVETWEPTDTSSDIVFVAGGNRLPPVRKDRLAEGLRLLFAGVLPAPQVVMEDADRLRVGVHVFLWELLLFVLLLLVMGVVLVGSGGAHGVDAVPMEFP